MLKERKVATEKERQFDHPTSTKPQAAGRPPSPWPGRYDRLGRVTDARDPVADLRRIAFLLERALESTYRVKAFRGAAAALAPLDPQQVADHVAAGTLTSVKGVGDVTAACIGESLAGRVPEYLEKLQQAHPGPVTEGGAELRAALRGDCHTHSDWSDGGSPIPEMAVTAVELGHEYMVLTDHSPRLTVANGLSPERLRQQLDLVTALGPHLTPFRLLTGIEVDILDDGGLDQQPDLLAELDLVVASVHSKLAMAEPAMTRRMLAAIANPHTDVLGHCTGRMVPGERGGGGGKSRGRANGRPESSFDAKAVFAACAQAGVAVEINSRPERLDPPRRLLRMAVQAGCLFTIDTDAHAPGQLDWQPYGCARAQECGVDPAMVVNTWPLQDLLAWTQDHRHRP
jgi:putative hydrolase